MGSVAHVKYLNINFTAMDSYGKVVSKSPVNLVKTFILLAILKMDCTGIRVDT